MENNGNQKPNLSEGATLFMASLSLKNKEIGQQEIYRFIRWYGWERNFEELTAPEVASYAEQLSRSDSDFAKKLKLIHKFLVFASKEEWTKSNLSTHLKAKKGKNRLKTSSKQSASETITLTHEGYDALKAELVTLKNKRVEAIDEIRKAAADKDFRENAPLDAAREQKSYLDGQIKEVEETLKSATIINGKQEAILKVNVGDSVILRDLISDAELRYTVVNTREVDLTKGKISNISPIGKAIVGRSQEEVVEIKVPLGKLRYKIEWIGR
ncbi:MAG: transcription elongation factor GreA [Dehalococcoidales bacterium]|nr:transcription elongation factor GreA [Dehalococcoidales bacterium]